MFARDENIYPLCSPNEFIYGPQFFVSSGKKNQPGGWSMTFAPSAFGGYCLIGWSLLLRSCWGAEEGAK
jgi:hypothetical protein